MFVKKETIYGLKQSGCVWKETINEFLKMGLTISEVEQCRCSTWFKLDKKHKMKGGVSSFLNIKITREKYAIKTNQLQ